MDQSDLLFLVLIGIGLTTLAVLVMQLLKPRQRDNRGAWYEGPWDDDDTPRGPMR